MSDEPRILVPDSSVIILLDGIGESRLISQLAARVIVTEAVATEVAAGGALGREPSSGLSELCSSPYAVPAEAKLLHGSPLGRGELSVISVCINNEGALAGLDDLRARQTATRLGVPVIGTLGLLLLAHTKGLVADPLVLAEG